LPTGEAFNRYCNLTQLGSHAIVEETTEARVKDIHLEK